MTGRSRTAAPGALRPFDRRALRPLDELELAGGTELFVLTLPGGDVEVYETPRHDLVVWAYTAFVPVAVCRGPGQPFVRVSVDELREACLRLDPRPYVAVDVVPPGGVHYPEPDRHEREPLPLIDPAIPDTSTLWLPVRPGSVGTTRPAVEMAEGERGEPVLLAYTSLARLRAELGQRRAAVSVRADRLDHIVSQTGAGTVAVDAAVPGQRRDTDFPRHRTEN